MRKAVDPFGISILDLLSNALGATILLMLIVSIKSRGTSEKPNDAPPKVGSGQFMTLIGKERKIKDSLRPDYSIQIKLFDHKDSIKVTGTAQRELFRTDSLDLNDYWLVKVDGNAKGVLSVKLNNISDDSIWVQSTVFRGGAPISHDKKKLKDSAILKLDVARHKVN